MLHVLVVEEEGNYGYSYEDTHEFSSYSRMIDYIVDNPGKEILVAYAASEKISSNRLRNSALEVIDKTQSDRDAALAKLTPYERNLLGVEE